MIFMKIKNKIIILLLVVLVVMIVLNQNKFNLEKEQTVSTSMVEETLKNLWQLSVLKYSYSNVIVYEEAINFKGTRLPFTEKGFLIKYTGYIKAGINLDSMELLIDDENNITVSLNKAEVLDNVINEEDIYIYDERSSLFNPLRLEDLYTVLPAEKKAMEEEIIAKGFLQEANEKASLLIENLLSEMGFTKIIVTFK